MGMPLRFPHVRAGCWSSSGVCSPGWGCWEGYRIPEVSTSRCFCRPNIHFHCCSLFYQAERHEKEGAEGREQSIFPLGLCSELREFPESLPSFASLKTWSVAIALGIYFLFIYFFIIIYSKHFSWFNKKLFEYGVCGDLVQWNQTKGPCSLS